MTDPLTYDLERKRSWRYSLRNLLSGFLSLIVIAAIAFTGFLFFLSQEFQKPGPLQQETVITVRKGLSLSDIARWLKHNKIIEESNMFVAGVMFHRANSKLRAGEYRFKAGITMHEIMRQMIEGRSILHKFTAPEGLTSQQIIERIKSDPILIGEIENQYAEGELLPETYVYQRGLTREKLLEKMRRAQKKLLDDLWPKRDKSLPIKSRQEALVLASIVEKETGIAAERKRVAAVFINRLRRSMRLQSDPTIIYGIVGGKGSLGRPIRQSEIRQKTPYNTYEIDGLPPTPIANPGRAAIAAVLNPASTNELYFVADGTGGHVFAETLAQHNSNVQKWRRFQKQQKTKPQIPAPPKPKIKSP